VTEQLAKFVEQYWIILAAIVLFWTNPAPVKALLAKFSGGLIKPPDGGAPSAMSDLDLVKTLAEVNAANGYGADEEIKALFAKFMKGTGTK
jgi:hypothetical protein